MQNTTTTTTEAAALSDLLTVNEVSAVYKPLAITFEMDKINTPLKSSELLRSLWSDEIGYREEFNVLLLNRASKALTLRRLSAGGVAGTVVDVRQVFQFAIMANASSIILAHNHPSGNSKPSGSDIEITRRIKEAAKLFDIVLLDHIILTPDSYYSFADNGDL